MATAEGFAAIFAQVTHSPHPYTIIADYILSATSTPRRPIWAQVLSIGNLLASLLLLSAAIATCWIRFRRGTFSLGQITSHHLIRPNSPICFSLGCIGYGILSSGDLTLGLIGDQKGVMLPGQTTLAFMKCMFIWQAVWCFIWGSVVHHIVSLWIPPWETHAPLSNTRVPPLVVASLNFLFSICSLIALIVPLVLSIIIEIRTQQTNSLVLPVVEYLRMQDIGSHSTPFNITTVLQATQPLFALGPVSESIMQLLKANIMTWCILLCCSALLSALLLGFSLLQARKMGLVGVGRSPGYWYTLRQMMQRSRSTTINSGPVKFNYAREHSVFVILCSTILATEFIILPLPFWQYANTKVEELRTFNYMITPQLIIATVISIICNIVMVTTLKQTMRMIRSTPTKIEVFQPMDDLQSQQNSKLPYSLSGKFEGPSDDFNSKPLISIQYEQRSSIPGSQAEDPNALCSKV